MIAGIMIIIKKIISFIMMLVMTFTYNTIVKSRYVQDEPEERYEKLFSGINAGNEQAIIEAIEEGADINEFSDNFPGTISPIVWAIHKQLSGRTINTMLKYDIDPDLIDIHGSTVFYECINTSDAVYRSLLEKDPDVNIECRGKNAIDYLIDAKYTVYTDRLKEVINKGAVVTDKNIENVIDKINSDDLDRVQGTYILKMLIDEYRGNIKKLDKNIYAAYTGGFSKKNKCEEDVVLYGLAGYGTKDVLAENINEDSDLSLLLRIAVMANNIENVKFLLDNGATMKIEGVDDKPYEDALAYAVVYNRYDMIKYIVSLYPDDIDTALVYAVENDQSDVVKFLIENGADVNNTSVSRTSLFSIAVSHNCMDIIKLYIESGYHLTDPDTGYVREWNLRDLANRGNFEIIKYVCSKGNKFDDNQLNELVHGAVERGDIDLLKYLVTLGAKLNTPLYEDTNYNNLFKAAWHGYLDIVEFLVENGVNTDDYSDEELESLNKRAKYSNEIYNYLNERNLLTRSN